MGGPGLDFETWDRPTHPAALRSRTTQSQRSRSCRSSNAESWTTPYRINPINLGAPGPDFRTWDRPTHPAALRSRTTQSQRSRSCRSSNAESWTTPYRINPINLGAPGPDFRTWDRPTHPAALRSRTTQSQRSRSCRSSNAESWTTPYRINPINLGAPGPDFRTWETTNPNQRFSDPCSLFPVCT